MSKIKWFFWCRQFKKYKELYEEDSILFNNGSQRINSELDCVSIISNLRQVKLLLKMVLNENQIMLSKYAKSNTISSQDSLEPLDEFHYQLSPIAGENVILPLLYGKQNQLNDYLRRVAGLGKRSLVLSLNSIHWYSMKLAILNIFPLLFIKLLYWFYFYQFKHFKVILLKYLTYMHQKVLPYLAYLCSFL